MDLRLDWEPSDRTARIKIKYLIIHIDSRTRNTPLSTGKTSVPGNDLAILRVANLTKTGIVTTEIDFDAIPTMKAHAE